MKTYSTNVSQQFMTYYKVYFKLTKLQFKEVKTFEY